VAGASVEINDFFFRGRSPIGCLLIHGFTGTPYEMRYLGERLNEAGHTVRGIRLPGHATLGGDLYQAGWREWYGEAVNGVDDLLVLGLPVVAIGISMGSLLALRLAAERADAVCRVAALAPAIVLGDRRLHRTAPLLRAMAPLLPVRWAARPKLGSDIADQDARSIHPLFPMPLRGMAELDALQQSVRPLLPRITQPALVLHGRLDAATPLMNVEILLRELGSKQITKRVFDRSAHILTVDAEKDEVATEVARFVAEAAHA